MDEAEHFDEIHDPKMWLTATALKYFRSYSRNQKISQSLSDCSLAVA
jgi:hypothetical protein